MGKSRADIPAQQCIPASKYANSYQRQHESSAIQATPYQPSHKTVQQGIDCNRRSRKSNAPFLGIGDQEQPARPHRDKYPVELRARHDRVDQWWITTEECPVNGEPDQRNRGTDAGGESNEASLAHGLSCIAGKNIRGNCVPGVDMLALKPSVQS